MSTRDPARDVSMSASLEAEELHVVVPAKTRVTFTGEGKVVTRRAGIPPTGTRAGETYRNVKVATEIAARMAREEPPERE